MSDHPFTLLVAFELGERSWKLRFTTGIGQRPRVRQIPAGAVDRVLEEVTRATARVGVPVAAPVVSCYEAGRDGFWLHRFLVAHAVTNYVVDSSSIEVPRRARRAKTDKLDLVGGLQTARGWCFGRSREGGGLFWKAADGTGEVERLLESTDRPRPWRLGRRRPIGVRPSARRHQRAHHRR